jgi:A/G-specific adenine glycosylase
MAQKLIDKENPGDHNQAIMEFGAKQCKPSNPECTVCPLNSECEAFKRDMIGLLPIKINKTKVKKKYFNYLVFISDDNETVIEQRQGKGIWQNLYQFPLIESNKSLSLKALKNEESFQAMDIMQVNKIHLFEDNEVIHKLSHQHLHTKFWVIETNTIGVKSVPLGSLKDYPVPRLIENFLEEFLDS